jgi:diguanylate cyclase (GGDEF)-like protein
MARRKKVLLREQVLEREDLLNRISTKIRCSLELQEILTTTVQEIRAFLGVDRVKIYQFAADDSGEVIAESIRDNRLPSLLGLRFPAEDIPTHARELFIKARQRVIIDVLSQQQIQERLDCPVTGKRLVHQDIRYAPVDPCHIEYLTTMGVRSSLSVPILHQNNLWGLLACHHGARQRFSERDLQIVQLLVDQLSIAIAQSNLLQRARQQAHHEATLNQISSLLHSPLNVGAIRQSVLEDTVKALKGSGGRLYITPEPTHQASRLYTCGEQPTIPWIEEDPLWKQIIINLDAAAIADNGVAEHSSTAHWHTWELAREHPIPIFQEYNLPEKSATLPLGLSHYSSLVASSEQEPHNNYLVPQLYSIDDLYKEPKLQSLISGFETTAIRSMLVVPLHYHQQCVGCLTVFRDEIETETLWAGRVDRDQRNYRPRASFNAWREIIKGQSLPWTVEDIKLAQVLGIHLYMAIMQRRVEDTIRHQASHDRLTGLSNRLLFDDHLSLALAQMHQQREMLAVLFLDLDGFKTINDTLGHAVGDQLLQSVAQRLQEGLRQTDTIARWGGDEFTILLSPINSTDEVETTARTILDTLNTPLVLDNQELYIKASLGIALAPLDGKDADTLLKNADAAMYRAKQKGRNNYQLYTPAIGTKVQERLVLENNLYKALEREEFRLYYQPQIDIKTGEIVGMEALIRWQSGERGLIAPNLFIPMAEEMGLIGAIGEWVLQTACTQNRIWRSLGLPALRVGVNLSACQFQQKNLVQSIAQVLNSTGLAPHYLELEITESIAMQDVPLTISVLRSLREMGIQIAMDDFGTGYSSLSSLKHFPLDKLKIDRSFVQDLPTDSHDAAIITAVVALGRGLNLAVVAEGVETKEQLAFLKSVGCDQMQGYLFSRPLSEADATQLFLLRQAS